MSAEYEILETILDWCGSGEPVALATVVHTWGSAPRPVGSQMGITRSGAFIGSVSGGCVEGAVIAEAMDVLETGKMRLLEYGVTNDQAWELGLPCGGNIQVMVQIVSTDTEERTGLQILELEEIAAVKTSSQSRFLATNLSTYNAYLLAEGDNAIDHEAPNGPTAAETKTIIGSTTSKIIEAPGETWFVRIYTPPLKLVIVGAVHIAEHLSHIALASGYEVTIVDPRPAFANANRFGGANIVVEWPDTAMAELTLDTNTALVALSHDPKLDDAALLAALNASCFYIGALGSRKNHAKRLKRLAAHGLSDKSLTRIHGPVGLPIGAQSPAEIAIAIAAEMTSALRLGPSP